MPFLASAIASRIAFSSGKNASDTFSFNQFTRILISALADYYRIALYYHLILTDSCNLSCTYCRGRAFDCLDGGEPEIDIDPSLPPDIDYDLGILYRFLARDDEATLTFYGGEPLLRADLIAEIVAHAPVKTFMMQTNGLLLDQLPQPVMERFSTILVSIDGPRDLTDAHRGSGTYDRVIRNVRALADRGFRGEVIARMTVDEQTDIERSVGYLANNDDHAFSAIHWQIDANFWQDFGRRDFVAWADQSYNPGIRRLVGAWVDEMAKNGRVLRWYPFLDTMQDLLLGKPSRLRCGSGYANFSIMTDGHIAPCPIMVGMRRYYLGHIATADPHTLGMAAIDGECRRCRIFDFCGGRCLYAQVTCPWPAAGRQAVCGTVAVLHDALVRALPRVRGLIDEGAISLSSFGHEKYNGCEIIP